MSVKIIFSLTLSNKGKPQNVSICFDDKDPLEMNLIPNEGNHEQIIYEISIPVDTIFNKYPSKILYNYKIDDALLYENNQPLLFTKRPSVNNIFINDDEKPKSENFQNIIIFCIKQPFPVDPQNVLCLEADAPVFIGEGYQKRAILMQREGNHWLGVGIVSPYLSQPIVYKYIIRDQNNNEILREKGRMHTLYLNTPASNKMISVNDIWTDSMPPLAFYPHVISPHKTRSNEAIVSFEYTSPLKDTKTVILAVENKKAKTTEQLFHEDCWRGVFNIPKADIECKYSFGTSATPNDQNSDDWNNTYEGNLYTQESSSDYISSRILFEPLSFKKLISVYIPLVSIRESIKQSVGEFRTLVPLARWCRIIGIDCIHVHIEHLHHGLLDPIHANGINWPDDEESDELNGHRTFYKFRKVNAKTKDDSNDRNSNPDPLNVSFHSSHHGSLLMPTVRDSKVRKLYSEFLEWNQRGTDKGDFESFLECNEHIARNCGGTFEKWVQFTLFGQLEDAFQQIIEIGVQLVTDVTIAAKGPTSAGSSNNDDDRLNSSTCGYNCNLNLSLDGSQNGNNNNSNNNNNFNNNNNNNNNFNNSFNSSFNNNNNNNNNFTNSGNFNNNNNNNNFNGSFDNNNDNNNNNFNGSFDNNNNNFVNGFGLNLSSSSVQSNTDSLNQFPPHFGGAQPARNPEDADNDNDTDNDKPDDDPASELASEIRTASRYSHGLVIVGLCPHRHPLASQHRRQQQQPRGTRSFPLPYVRSLFGPIAQTVLDHFFRASELSVRLLDNAFVLSSVHEFASTLNASARETFESSMRSLTKQDESYSDGGDEEFIFTEEQKRQIDMLRSVASNSSCAIVLDQMSCDAIGQEEVVKMGILPCATDPSRRGVRTRKRGAQVELGKKWLGPAFVSPEMASEFPAQMHPEAIAECVRARVSADEQAVEVYMIDLLRALGYDAGVEPIQMIRGHCRFLLQFTLQDLFGDEETNEKIRAILVHE